MLFVIVRQEHPIGSRRDVILGLRLKLLIHLDSLHATMDAAQNTAVLYVHQDQ